MHDSNKRESNARTGDSEDSLQERKADATSDETLSDLKETEKDSRLPDTDSDPGPSPDGAIDETDELKDAGPM